jgi:hypothetical protein
VREHTHTHTITHTHTHTQNTHTTEHARTHTHTHTHTPLNSTVLLTTFLISRIYKFKYKFIICFYFLLWRHQIFYTQHNANNKSLQAGKCKKKNVRLKKSPLFVLTQCEPNKNIVLWTFIQARLLNKNNTTLLQIDKQTPNHPHPPTHSYKNAQHTVTHLIFYFLFLL